MYSLLIILKEKTFSVGWIFYLLIFLMLFIGVVVGITMWPQFMWLLLQNWYFYFFVVLTLISNVVCTYLDLDWWKTLFIGADIFALCVFIASFLIKDLYIWDEKFLMNVLSFITLYTMSFISGLIVSAVGSLVTYKTPLIDKFDNVLSKLKLRL